MRCTALLSLLCTTCARKLVAPSSRARELPPSTSLALLVDRLRGSDGQIGLRQESLWERRTISELIELNRQLQLEHARSVAAARRAWQYAPPRMVVVANRLPLSVKRNADGQLEYSISSGGMVSALLGVRNVRMVWVGWCPVPDDATSAELDQVRRALLARGCVPVFIPPDEAEAYYNGFCNDVLWPLFHYVIARTPEMDDAAEREQEQWQAYQRANARFAEVVDGIARESDIVWVHDYHLMLLPALLRAARPHLKIGWFLHTPWPSSEVFRTLPMRRDILQGLLGADLVGFHVYDYARHFLHSCTRLLGSEVSFDARRLRWERPLTAAEGGGVVRHSVKVDAFPIGIDPQRFKRALESQRVKERVAQLRQQFKGCKLLLGIDRVDYVKGIPQKLLAMEALLQNHPELVGKVVLLQIAVPTRIDVPEYQKVRGVVHRLVGRINGKFGSPSYVPIHYLDQSIEFEEMVALYHTADVCIVTSLRDGMNLVSYEFVACQEDDCGVLVLSEFTGAAQALGAGCIRVNPYNIEELTRSLADAIQMEKERRAELHAYASQYVAKFTSQAWAQDFITGLEEPDPEELHTSYGAPLPLHNVVTAYSNATRRLLILGVGGTFLPATGATANDDVELTADQRQLLAKLLADPANTVLLTSGRSRAKMDELIASFRESDAETSMGASGEALVDNAVPASHESDLDRVTGLMRSQPVGETLHEIAGGRGDYEDDEDDELDLTATTLAAAVAAVTASYSLEQSKDAFAPLDAASAAATDAATTHDSELDDEDEVATNGLNEREDGQGEEMLDAEEPKPRTRGRLWTLAESGVFARVDGGKWETTLQAAQTDEWLESVEEVFRYFEERTPGSRVERRDRTIRWAYGSADVELGAQQASNLVEHLEKLLGDAPVEKSWEGTCVEVRPHGSSCGHGLLQLLAADLGQSGALQTSERAAVRGFDFVLGLGNFSARDEDLFLQLHAIEASPDEFGDPSLNLDGQGGAADGAEADADVPLFGDQIDHGRALDVPSGGVFSVILGNRSTHARYFLPTEREATHLLRALTITPQSPRAAADTLQILAAQEAAALAGEATTVSSTETLPNALERSTLVTISERVARYWTPAFCLDYDGTLSPIVTDPAAARLPPGTKALLRELSDRHPTAIVSGRSMEKLRSWIDVSGLYFAASYGFEISGPHGSQLNYTFAEELLPTIQAALSELRESLNPIPGVMIEDNKFALSIHTRNVSAEDRPRLDALLEAALEEQPLLRQSEGKHVIELRPQVHWHKGRAVEWLLKNMCEQMGLPSGAGERHKRVVPIYIGDDTSDEDAFELLRSKDHGIPIIVREKAPTRGETSAEFWLRQREVADFLALFLRDLVLIQMPDAGSEVGGEGFAATQQGVATSQPGVRDRESVGSPSEGATPWL